MPDIIPTPPPPNQHCYWVIPGQLMAGFNPTRPLEEATRDNLSQLLLAGVRVMIDLTEEFEIIPYQPLLMEQAQAYGHDAEYYKYPIQDMGVCSREYLAIILNRIDAALAQQMPVYVHCYAGVGRTGLVVGCHMVRHGMSGEQALERIADLRQDVSMAWMRSPESDAQVAMLMNWRAGD